MIHNIVFDIGNVCMTFNPYSYFIKHFQDEELTKKLCRMMFQHEAWLRYDQGVVSREVLFHIYHQEYPQYQKEIDWMLEHWMELMEPIKETFDAMQTFKKQGYGIYLLSNISADSANFLKATQPFFEYIDGAVLSYEVKAIKPNCEIYEELFQRYQLTPETCMFLDDSAANIAMGESLGMKGIVFQNVKKDLDKAKAFLLSEVSIC